MLKVRSYELKHHAAKRFSHIADRIQREHDAETDLVDEYFERRNEGFFVEVGANDPQKLSQTWKLEQRGWTGLLIEPIPELCERLRQARPNSQVIQAACGAPEETGEADFYVASDSEKSTLRTDMLDFPTPVQRVERVRVRTLDDILQQCQLPRIDFVSVDVEGLQLSVLRGLTLSKYRPALLMVEDHLTDLRTHRFLTQRNYRLVKRTGLNNWYLPADAPFHLTSQLERYRLWQKMWLRTPIRKLRFAARRRR